MADDVATMQRQLDELKAAYRSGAQTVSYEGKNVVWRDGNELRAAIASLEAKLGVQTVRTIAVRSEKGW